MKKTAFTLLAGIILGIMLAPASFAEAVETLVSAYPSTHTVYLDGQKINLDAYVINGSNYVKLRDIGEKVGFNVFWRDGVQVDTTSPYTGEPPAMDNASPETAQTDLDSVRQEMIQRINQVRRENGVEELVVNNALMDAAQICSAQGFTTHNSQFECETALACGYPYGCGVNLTVFTINSNTPIAQRAVSHWVYSSGHLQTMIDPAYESVGIGVTVANDRAYCYMFVGSPNSHNPYE